jgi:hypothetical protein
MVERGPFLGDVGGQAAPWMLACASMTWSFVERVRAIRRFTQAPLRWPFATLSPNPVMRLQHLMPGR